MNKRPKRKTKKPNSTIYFYWDIDEKNNTDIDMPVRKRSGPSVTQIESSIRKDKKIDIKL